ncbi:MAG: PEP-CTERM sorting domain-containing protein [Pirellulales bacterium]|nr:PEP-CTERM sorting domain-containing protein [Pirellulales bacterium]
MIRRVIAFVLSLAMAGAAQAAVTWDWTGGASTTDWYTPGNWSFTGTTSYTQPSEQYDTVPAIDVIDAPASGPNYAYINSDITAININGTPSGVTVDKTVELPPFGIGDHGQSSYLVTGGVNCTMTLDNAATLNVGNTLWLAEDVLGAGGVTGQLNVLGGSTLNADILRIGHGGTATFNVTGGSAVNTGNGCDFASATKGVATVNITNSAFSNTAVQAKIAAGEESTAIVNLTNSVFSTGDFLQVGFGVKSHAEMYVTNSTVNVAERLVVGRGSEANAYIKVDNSTLNLATVGDGNRIYLGIATASNPGESTGAMDILNGSTVNFGVVGESNYVLVGSELNSNGILNIDNSSMNILGTDLNIGHRGGKAQLNVTGGSTLLIGRDLNSSQDTTATGGLATINISDSTVTTTTGKFRVSSGYGTVTANLTNATINTGMEVRVAESGQSVGYLNIHNGTTINCGLDFETCTFDTTATGIGSRAYVHMYNGDVNIDGYMCLSREVKGGAYTEFIMDDGTVDIGLAPAPDPEEFLDNLILGWFDTDAEANLTINGGRMTVAGAIRMGNEFDWDGGAVPLTGSDLGKLRLTIDGGVLEAADYVDAGTFTDHLIIMNDGELRLLGSAVSETEMLALITGGDISCPNGYTIYTDGDYTVLEATAPKTPGDADRDGDVDADDARRLAENWLRSDMSVQWRHGDFNDDGRVDDLDASILAANWGTGVEGVGVPEPGSVALLLGLVAGLALWRRSR